MNGIWEQALELWRAGGWAMIPLALNAFLLCAKAVEVRLQLGTKGYMDNRWGLVQKLKGAGNFESAELESAALVAHDYLAWQDIDLPDSSTPAAVGAAFAEVRAREVSPLDRDLKLIKVAMAAAPLWGLLGTVSGMLATFSGLATGGGGDKTMNMVAGGISEALITTQTGLMVALPGYFLHYYLVRHRDRFVLFLEHLENAYSQHTHQLRLSGHRSSRNVAASLAPAHVMVRLAEVEA